MASTIRASLRTCLRKTQYPTRAAAEAALAEMLRRANASDRVTLHAYRCGICAAVHIGRNPRRLKAHQGKPKRIA